MIDKLYICVTDGCNLSCKGCYKYLFPVLKPKQLDLQLVNEYLKENSPSEVTFHGGEPFYNCDKDRILEYIHLVKQYPNIKWTATTNLIYDLNDDLLNLFELFFDKFLKTSWDVDNYRFRTLEQRELWEKNVKKLLSLGFIVQPIITVNIYTIKHEPETLFKYFKDLGITNINFERITLSGRATINKIRPTNREIDEWLYCAYNVNKKYNFIIPIFEELTDGYKIGHSGCRKRQCMQCVRTINTDGSIGACPNISNEHIIENGIYNKTLEEKLINEEKIKNPKCLMCKFYKYCNGDCCQLIWDETGCPGLIKIMESLK